MTNSGPFASAALDLAARGLAVIPVGGDDGKTPLVAWGKWRRPPGKIFLQKLSETHGGANVGLLTGLSDLVVVDIDDASLADKMISRFGETPLIVATPSGGRHLYFRAAGEGCHNLRGDGLAVDVKGAGGFVVAPPSVRPSGPHAGKFYRIICGSWDDLLRLPKVRPGSLPAAWSSPRSSVAGAVIEGRRNNSLFRFLLSEARACATVEALQNVAAGWNDLLVAPLPDAEIARTVASAWNFQISGRNWTGDESFVKVRRSEFDSLCRHPDALALRIFLRFQHEGLRSQFAFSPKAMRKAALLPEWGLRRIRGARDWLIDENFLCVEHQGGKKPGDESQYRLGFPALPMGYKMEPNTNKHPLPLEIPPRHFAPWLQNRAADDGMLDLVQLAGGDAPPRRIDAKIFGTWAKAERQARGLTQAAVAQRAGISRAALANVERAEYAAGIDLQRRLGAILSEAAA